MIGDYQLVWTIKRRCIRVSYYCTFLVKKTQQQQQKNPKKQSWNFSKRIHTLPNVSQNILYSTKSIYKKLVMPSIKIDWLLFFFQRYRVVFSFHLLRLLFDNLKQCDHIFINTFFNQDFVKKVVLIITHVKQKSNYSLHVYCLKIYWQK